MRPAPHTLKDDLGHRLLALPAFAARLVIERLGHAAHLRLFGTNLVAVGGKGCKQEDKAGLGHAQAQCKPGAYGP
jgi:hypothetical protein